MFYITVMTNLVGVCVGGLHTLASFYQYFTQQQDSDIHVCEAKFNPDWS